MDQVIALCKARFGLNEAEFQRVDHADTMVAVVYRVVRPAKQTLILKVCPSAGDFQRELYFLKQLAGVLPVPGVIDSLQPSQSTAGAILMEYIDGHLLGPKDWSDSLAHEVGSALAKLHLVRTEEYGDLTKPASLTLPAGRYFEAKFNEELDECRSHLPKPIIDQCEYFLHSQRHLLDFVDGPCIVHRDFRPGNIIVRNGELQGIIDWAGARSGFAEQDFCSMEHTQWPSQPSHKKALLKGYAEIRPVPNYQQIMPLLRLGRALAVIGFTVKSNTWQGKNLEIYQKNRRFLEEFVSRKD